MQFLEGDEERRQQNNLGQGQRREDQPEEYLFSVMLKK